MNLILKGEIEEFFIRYIFRIRSISCPPVFYKGTITVFTALYGEKKSSLKLLNWSIRISFSSIYSLGFLWNQDSKSEVKKPMRIPFPVARLFQELKLAYLKAIKSPLKLCMWFYRAHTSLIFFPYFGISWISQKVLL